MKTLFVVLMFSSVALAAGPAGPAGMGGLITAGPAPAIGAMPMAALPPPTVPMTVPAGPPAGMGAQMIAPAPSVPPPSAPAGMGARFESHSVRPSGMGAQITAPPPQGVGSAIGAPGAHSINREPQGIGQRIVQPEGIGSTVQGQTRPLEWERDQRAMNYNRYNYAPVYGWGPYYRDWGFYWGVNSWYDIRSVTCESENTETHQTYRATETRADSWTWNSSLVNKVAAQALDQCAAGAGGRTDQCRLVARKCWNY